MDHWKGSNLDVSVWRCFNWREPFGRDKVWWNYLEVTTWKLSNSEGKVTFGSRVHWGASLFRRHHWERNHWEMGNVSLWGRVTFGARAIERRQSGGESGAREAIVLHPGDISCTQLNHTWLENIFLENFTTIIDEVNLLHTNKQLYIKSIFWSQGRTFNCNAKKNSVFLLALSSPKHKENTTPQPRLSAWRTIQTMSRLPGGKIFFDKTWFDSFGLRAPNLEVSIPISDWEGVKLSLPSSKLWRMVIGRVWGLRHFHS